MIKRLLRLNRWSSRLLEAYFFSIKYLKPKGWFESRYLHQPLDINGDPIPWLTYSSIHFISQKLNLRPMNVFEFGSGNSTLWFSSRVERIISIENDVDFYNTMVQKIGSISNVSYQLKTLNNTYSTKILEYDNEFDILIIDGRERVQCTINSLKALKKDGIIIFDNSDRLIYQEAYDFLEKNQFKKLEFQGVGPIGHQEWKTTIFYREDNCFEI
ncbi:hypothetical protein [Patiriisocius sp. Uisw_017]|jgi:hypothetical protein|uniref:hypothetical protein n=1 Tax=Patiriisocius sp. Uisw_017 TaxID=3230968 RepID=UPI0039E8D8CF